MTVEEILAKLQEIIDEAGDRPLTDEEIERYEELETQLKAVQRSQEIRSRQQAYLTPVQSAVNVGTVKTDDTLERAFDHYLRTGRENADITELRAQGVGTDAAGGFTVPETMLTKITERMKAYGGLAEHVETITTDSGEPIRWPTLDDTSNSGVIAAEGTAPATGGADLVFGEKTLGAFKYVAPGASQLPLRVSLELLQDSGFDIQGLVTRKLAERIARVQAVDWVAGAGTTEPFGIITSTTTEVEKDALTYADLVDIVHSVDPAYRVGAKWAFNDATLALVERLEDDNGRPLLGSTTNGISSGLPNTTLLGYPVVIDQAFASVGAAESGNRYAVFGDLAAGYVIRRVKDVTLIVNPYSRANEGQVEYTMWARADGTVQDPRAFAVVHNSEEA